MKKLTRKQSLTVGSLLFGMLFGSGNVIFPPMLGQNAGGSYLPAAIGFLIAAVGLPILAIISFSLSRKETLKDYAGQAGQGFGLFYTLLLLLTIGPLFAMPRNATVAFEVGIKPLLSGETTLPLLIYSLVFFSLALYFSLRPARILDVIGRLMAPLFIFLMGILLVMSFTNPMGNPASFEAQGAYAQASFPQGLIDGYQTMDVLACVAFGITIITTIRQLGIRDEADIARETGRSSLFTLVIMSILYLGLTYIGASSMGIMPGQENGGQILVLTAKHYLGNLGLFLLGLTITVACLKTVIGLAVSISQTFVRLFPQGPSDKAWTLTFIGVAFLLANFGLNTIIKLSVPALMFLYPLTITLILLWLLNAVTPLKKAAFTLTIILAAIPAFFDCLAATPEAIAKSAPISALLAFPENFLPLYKLGMGWLVPVAIALVLSLLFLRKKEGAMAA